ncbi:hypothetical protein Trco_000364 [Trichoderma cornu-damae]|uniref:Uncharacterized protein n=1 Tax=Trichoderma cornu-damae TaxID=654480 RepID=A0A9P8U095_9HYPO|nr:hypothetical protein Trco_000364 [Trichoderma cornu-damae]
MSLRTEQLSRSSPESGPLSVCSVPQSDPRIAHEGRTRAPESDESAQAGPTAHIPRSALGEATAAALTFEDLVTQLFPDVPTRGESTQPNTKTPSLDIPRTDARFARSAAPSASTRPISPPASPKSSASTQIDLPVAREAVRAVEYEARETEAQEIEVPSTPPCPDARPQPSSTGALIESRTTIGAEAAGGYAQATPIPSINEITTALANASLSAPDVRILIASHHHPNRVNSSITHLPLKVREREMFGVCQSSQDASSRNSHEIQPGAWGISAQGDHNAVHLVEFLLLARQFHVRVYKARDAGAAKRVAHGTATAGDDSKSSKRRKLDSGSTGQGSIEKNTNLPEPEYSVASLRETS